MTKHRRIKCHLKNATVTVQIRDACTMLTAKYPENTTLHAIFAENGFKFDNKTVVMQGAFVSDFHQTLRDYDVRNGESAVIIIAN